MKIAYEPHPVTPERKAELRSQGYKILDVAFKPADFEEAPKRGRKPKAEAVEPEADQPTE